MHRALILATGIVVASAAGTAHAETRTLSLPGFTAVDVSNGIPVELVVGPAQSVILVGEPRVLERVRAEVRGSTLSISAKKTMGMSWNSFQDLKVRISAPAISAVSASSGADIRADGFTGGPLALKTSSGAELRASGACAALTAAASSGSNLDARRLNCATVSVEASSGAQVDIVANGSLTARASSGGDIDVRGAPTSVQQSTSSGGDVSIRPST